MAELQEHCWGDGVMKGEGTWPLESRQRGLESQGGDNGCENRFEGETVAADD